MNEISILRAIYLCLPCNLLVFTVQFANSHYFAIMCKDCNVRFTTIPLKVLSYQISIYINILLSSNCLHHFYYAVFMRKWLAKFLLSKNHEDIHRNKHFSIFLIRLSVVNQALPSLKRDSLENIACSPFKVIIHDDCTCIKV